MKLDAEATEYKGWPLLDVLPDGWVVDKKTGSPVTGYLFCRSTKSRFDPAYKQALVRQKIFSAQEIISQEIVMPDENAVTETYQANGVKRKQTFDADCAKTFNDLARAKFKQKILGDILVDLTICDLEGWDKTQYIEEIKELVGNIGAQYKQGTLPI